MAKLDSSLAQAEQIFRELQSVAAGGDTDAKRRVVQLRSRYASTMLDIMQARKTDERMTSCRDLGSEFDRLFFDVRQALATHQAKWRLQEIENDTAGYVASAAGLDRVQEDLYHWARSTFAPG